MLVGELWRALGGWTPIGAGRKGSKEMGHRREEQGEWVTSGHASHNSPDDSIACVVQHTTHGGCLKSGRIGGNPSQKPHEPSRATKSVLKLVSRLDTVRLKTDTRHLGGLVIEHLPLAQVRTLGSWD